MSLAVKCLTRRGVNAIAGSQQLLVTHRKTTPTIHHRTPKPLHFPRDLTHSTKMESSVPPPELSKVESAKRKAAFKAVADHFTSDMRFVRQPLSQQSTTKSSQTPSGRNRLRKHNSLRR